LAKGSARGGWEGEYESYIVRLLDGFEALLNFQLLLLILHARTALVRVEEKASLAVGCMKESMTNTVCSNVGFFNR
jgi:hypothetical protein